MASTFMYNPNTIGKDSSLIGFCEGILMLAAVKIQSTEEKWVNANSLSTGYDKRMKLASDVIQTKGKVHAGILAIIIAEVHPNILQDEQNVFNYLYDTNVCESSYRVGSGFADGTTTKNDPLQIWNILANVTFEDCTR